MDTDYNVGLDEWRSASGTTAKIAELETGHLLNIVAKLYRPDGVRNNQRNKLVTLEKEVVKRLTGLANPSTQ